MTGFVRIHLGIVALLGLLVLSAAALGATLVEDREDPWAVIAFGGGVLWCSALLYLAAVQGVVG